jgi:hypothetical protein
MTHLPALMARPIEFGPKLFDELSLRPGKAFVVD